MGTDWSETLARSRPPVRGPRSYASRSSTPPSPRRGPGGLYLAEKAGGEGHSELRRAMDALDATMRIARAAGDETDLEVISGPLAKRARAVVSARTPTIEREHDWTGTSG